MPAGLQHVSSPGSLARSPGLSHSRQMVPVPWPGAWLKSSDSGRDISVVSTLLVNQPVNCALCFHADLVLSDELWSLKPMYASQVG